mmetsp:Transcript_101948/g.247806  ORF Transcript_101948/g.247806 Transcript_101948/m.247806 type:complete len:236 (+) Transcript_101948:425-1132(+)
MAGSLRPKCGVPPSLPCSGRSAARISSKEAAAEEPGRELGRELGRVEWRGLPPVLPSLPPPFPLGALPSLPPLPPNWPPMLACRASMAPMGLPPAPNGAMPGPPMSGAAAPPQQEATRTRTILVASGMASGVPPTAMACTGRLPTETRGAICTVAPGQRSSMAVICAFPLPTTRPKPSSGTATRTSSGAGWAADSSGSVPRSLDSCSAMSSTALATAVGAPLISTRRWSEGPFSA